ncbi:hypothetical protein J3E69DRAFT_326077 [Trichoderma sp. SZMC 28015]
MRRCRFNYYGASNRESNGPSGSLDSFALGNFFGRLIFFFSFPSPLLLILPLSLFSNSWILTITLLFFLFLFIRLSLLFFWRKPVTDSTLMNAMQP